MIVTATHIVPANISGIRLSDYAVGIFEKIPTRKGIKKAIKKGMIWIDGAPATTGKWVCTGQVIQLKELDRLPAKVYKLKLPVIYEDATLALIHKPAGIVTSGNQFRTLQNTLPYNLQPSSASDALLAPLPVHRLDYSTSGLLLIAKTTSARRVLGNQFEQKQIQKEYRAVVIGQAPINGAIKIPIEQKIAHTLFQRLQTVSSLKNEYLSLLALQPTTGRTHQLRIHLSKIGFPILGDKLYGTEGMILKGKGLFLSAIGLQFTHPIQKELMRFTIAMPDKFSSYMAREQKRWDRVNKSINS